MSVIVDNDNMLDSRQGLQLCSKDVQYFCHLIIQINCYPIAQSLIPISLKSGLEWSSPATHFVNYFEIKIN